MLVGRCSWELSGRKLHRKIKRSQTPSEAGLSRLPRLAVEGSAVLRTSPGNVFEDEPRTRPIEAHYYWVE